MNIHIKQKHNQETQFKKSHNKSPPQQHQTKQQKQKAGKSKTEENFTICHSMLKYRVTRGVTEPNYTLEYKN